MKKIFALLKDLFLSTPSSELYKQKLETLNTIQYLRVRNFEEINLLLKKKNKSELDQFKLEHLILKGEFYDLKIELLLK